MPQTLTATIDISPASWTAMNLVNALTHANSKAFTSYHNKHQLTGLLLDLIERKGTDALYCHREDVPDHVEQKWVELIRKHFPEFEDNMPTYNEDEEGDL